MFLFSGKCNIKFLISLTGIFTLALCVLLLSACDDFLPEKPQAQKLELNDQPAPVTEATPEPKDPTLYLQLGADDIFMPAPEGFVRLPENHSLVRALQNTSPTGQVLLCVFMKEDSADAAIDLTQLAKFEYISVSTMAKWLNAKIASAEFVALQKEFKEKSALYTPEVASKFVLESTEGRLAHVDNYVYQLGLLDADSNHFSYARVDKKTGSDASKIFTCNIDEVFWVQGKILKFAVFSQLDNPDDVKNTVNSYRTSTTQLREAASNVANPFASDTSNKTSGSNRFENSPAESVQGVSPVSSTSGEVGATLVLTL